MKKILCAILTLVCILALCSCDLIEQFISFDRVEATIPADSIHTAPDANDSENQKPTDDKNDETTYDNNHSCTTPADENNDGIPDNEQNTNKPEDNPPTPEPETIMVSVLYQSGGIHQIQDTVVAPARSTFTHIMMLFAEKYPNESALGYAEGYYLNDQLIDPDQILYVNDGDRIYFKEGYNAHLHIYSSWGECRDCHIKCSHEEWNGNVCFFCKFECWHNEWEWDVCATCPFICPHENKDGDGRCQLCQMYIGEDILNIEIYEDYEEKPFYHQTTDVSLRGLILSLYPESLLSIIENKYDFYFNGTPIDSSYLITENGRLDMVTKPQ